MLCFFGKDWHFDDSLCLLKRGREWMAGRYIREGRRERGGGDEGLCTFSSREKEVMAWYGR
jgi:hypothetical protein